MNNYLKIVVFVIESSADDIRRVLGENGAGRIGNYDFCSSSTKSVGRFRPLKGSNPTVGELNHIEEVEEERIETICQKRDLKKIITAIKSTHPYEEPAIDVYELVNFEDI